MTNRREFLIGATVAGLAVATSAKSAHTTQGSAADPVSPRERTGSVVQTVQGPVDASDLGFTLPHEHLCPSSAGFWQVWPEFFGGRATFIAKVVDRLKAAKAEGVNTIVDVTTADLGRDIRLMEEISRRSGMQIIACTGHWLYPSLSMAARTVEELTDYFVLEIERGLDGTAMRPGVIKVATDREGVTPFLDSALRAAARASKATGIPVTTHTYAADRGGEIQAGIFEEEGLDPAKVCLGHCDDTDDMSYLTGLAERGYNIGMDHMTWGTRKEAGEANAEILSWQQRADTVRRLIAAGHCSRILLSNDWYFDISMAGTGFMQVMEDMNPDGMLFNTRHTIPHLRQIGVTDRDIRMITVENPRGFFGGTRT